MKFWYLFLFALLSMAIVSCQKSNDVSKIPQISLLYFGAGDGTDSVTVNKDTAFLVFTITDGDGDLGNDQSGTVYDIYIKDNRFGNYVGYFFPDFDKSIEDPKKGLTGTCQFDFTPDLISPRTRVDTANKPITRDTTSFEFYIVDRAGHQSNHQTTGPIFMHP